MGTENTGIMSANQLHIPEVTGEVKISLKEIDQLRTAHAQAIKIAQKLEAEQKMVKIEVWGTDHNIQYDLRSNQRYTTKVDSIKDVKFVNLEDIMEDLIKDATSQVAKAHAAEVSNLNQANERLSDKLNRSTESHGKLRDKLQESENLLIKAADSIKDLESQVESLTTEVDTLELVIEAKWEPLQEKYTELVDKWNELRKEKTFWAWLMAKFK